MFGVSRCRIGSSHAARNVAVSFGKGWTRATASRLSRVGDAYPVRTRAYAAASCTETGGA